MRPVVRRALAVVASGFALLVLTLLGLGLGALLYPAEPVRSEPPPPIAVVAAPAPAPPPGPVAAAPPPPPPPPPAPAPAATPPPEMPAPAIPDALPLATRLEIRRELISGMASMDRELAQCPAEGTPLPPGSRAALVLETVGGPDPGSVRVTASSLEADVPVNDRFVACARKVMEGRALAAPDAKPGVRLRMYVPLGPNGNSLSLSSASLTEMETP